MTFLTTRPLAAPVTDCGLTPSLLYGLACKSHPPLCKGRKGGAEVRDVIYAVSPQGNKYISDGASIGRAFKSEIDADTGTVKTIYDSDLGTLCSFFAVLNATQFERLLSKDEYIALPCCSSHLNSEPKLEKPESVEPESIRSMDFGSLLGKGATTTTTTSRQEMVPVGAQGCKQGQEGAFRFQFCTDGDSAKVDSWLGKGREAGFITEPTGLETIGNFISYGVAHLLGWTTGTEQTQRAQAFVISKAAEYGVDLNTGFCTSPIVIAGCYRSGGQTIPGELSPGDPDEL